MALIFVSLLLIVILISCFTYQEFSPSTFSKVRVVMSMFLTLLAGLVGIFPQLLYKHGTFVEGYDEYREFNKNARQACEHLFENNSIKEGEVGFDELCLHLVEEGNIEPPVSDKNIIEMTPPPQMAIKVDGEDSGETCSSVVSDFKILKERWDLVRDNEEKRRNREYSFLGVLILFLAVSVQSFQLLV